MLSRSEWIRAGVQFSIRYRYWLLSVASLLALLCLTVPPVEYDQSIESMFRHDDPARVNYRLLKSVFGGNEVVLVVYEDPAFWAGDAQAVSRQVAAAEQASRLPGVQGVLTPQRLLNLGDQAGGGPRWRERMRSLFEGYTHGADGSTLALVCLLDPQADQRQLRPRIVEQLQALADTLPGGVIAGEPVLVVEGFRQVKQDAVRLAWGTAILLGATIWYCFGSWRWVAIPLVVVQLSLLLTRGVLSLSGLELTMVSSMLTAVVTVIGVATLIHVMVRHRDLVHSGTAPLEAMRTSLNELLEPCSWAIFTDAASFLALCSAAVGPVRDFGLMMAVGSLMVLLSMALCLPGLALWKVSSQRGPAVRGSQRLAQLLGIWAERILAHPVITLVAVSVVTAAAAAGLPYLEVESDFTRNFRRNSSLVAAYAQVETRLGGAGILDIVIPAPATMNAAFVERVLAMETELRGLEVDSATTATPEPALTKVISVADALRDLNPVPWQALPSEMLRDQVVRGTVATMQKLLPEFFGSMIGRDPQTGDAYFRVMLRAHERQSAARKTELLERINAVMERHFPEARLTGAFVLIAGLIDSVIADQWLTFLWAVVAIAAMMSFAFYRLRWGVLLLIPNIVPITIVMGVLGWLCRIESLGFRVNLGVAMIAAVSTGLAIDGSIHYLFAVRRNRAEGLPRDQALIAAHRQVGLSLTLSTISLLVGFLVLCMSPFLPTVYFGALTALTMLGGTLGNLILMPLMISWFGDDVTRGE